MSAGSQQLRQFRIAIRDGASLEEACAATGGVIDEAEGKLHLFADAKNPPGPECFILIQAPPLQPKENNMASAAKKEDGEGAGITGEYKRPDARKAIDIYDKQIAPKLAHINTLKGDLSEPWGDLKEQSHVSKKDFGYVQGLVDEEDDAKREHRILSLFELMKARGIGMPDDLVTRADGTAGEPPIPTVKRTGPRLVTLPVLEPDQGDSKDLAAAAGLEPDEPAFIEMSEEELSAQEGRKNAAKTPAE